MQVNFVSQADPFLASHRFRAMKPVALLNANTNVSATLSKEPDTKADVNVFQKHFNKVMNIKAASNAQDLGYKTVFDICDDYFEREHAKYYCDMCELADVVTCNSANMQERIYEHTGKLARIINDPVSFPKGNPSVNTRPSFFMFGHGGNLVELGKWLPYIPGRVTVASNVKIDGVDFHQFKPGLVERMIREYDIVLIPTQKTPWVKCKSPNRVVDALNAGKFVITDNKDVYGEFKEFVEFVEDPAVDVNRIVSYYTDNPEEVLERITKGQKYVEETYTDEKILDGWVQVFKDLGLIKKVTKENEDKD